MENYQLNENTRFRSLTIKLIAIILTILGFTQTYLYKIPQNMNDIYWFPLGAIIKHITGNEILMLLAAFLQFFAVLEFSYRLTSRKLIFILLTISIYIFLVGTALLLRS